MDWFARLGVIEQAFLATLGTYLFTVLGTLPVLFFRAVPRALMDALMGFAGGVMVAASCWSLLAPAIRMGGLGPAVIGMLLGSGIFFAIDKSLPHLHPEFPEEAAPEGPRVGWHRLTLLMIAITAHNIPEGLAVGVAYGAEDVGTASALAIGIALQNIPEGLAIALPLRREGMSVGKAFWYGQLSAAVEPLAGVVGASAALVTRSIVPYTMAGAAAAMLYVVIEELIPETARQGTVDVATLGFLGGFIVMMSLDNAFG
jgi:ZIP family zinc transporter